jgi:hypothetical protein
MRIQLPELLPVDQYPVAPHRYLYDDPRPDPTTLAEARKNAPYKADEVIWCDLGGAAPKRCYVVYVGAEFNRHGEPREWYSVRPERKDRKFGTGIRYAYPGHVQRGYQKAGLAPDVPA